MAIILGNIIVIKFLTRRRSCVTLSNVRECITTKQSIHSHLATDRFASVHNLYFVVWCGMHNECGGPDGRIWSDVN